MEDNRSIWTWVVVIGILIGVYLIFFNKTENWSLSVCETKLNAYECDDIAYNIPDYKSQKECMQSGVALASKEGFECGKNCKQDGILNVCEVVCNSSGCSE